MFTYSHAKLRLKTQKTAIRFSRFPPREFGAPCTPQGPYGLHIQQHRSECAAPSRASHQLRLVAPKQGLNPNHPDSGSFSRPKNLALAGHFAPATCLCAFSLSRLLSFRRCALACMTRPLACGRSCAHSPVSVTTQRRGHPAALKPAPRAGFRASRIA